MSKDKTKAYHFLKKTAVPKSDATSHGMYNQLLSMKPHQLAAMKHILNQELGGEPSHFHPKYDSLELSNSQKQLLRQARITQKFDSPVVLAETYRKHHEKGGGLGSAITTGLKKTVDVLKVLGKKALQYGKKGAKYLLDHPELIGQIVEGVSTAVEIVGQMKGKNEEEKIDFADDLDTSDDDDEKASGIKASGIKASGTIASGISGRFTL